MIRRNEPGLPALVEDVLETNAGEWMTIARIVLEVQQVRPAARADSIGRAVWRVAGEPRLELHRRWADNGQGTVEIELMCPHRAYWVAVAA